MKIYVAGKWEERIYIQQLYRILKDEGHTITCDWTRHDYPKKNIEATLAKYAVDDINGVKNAELVIAVAENIANYRGMLVEIGAAIALDKPVIVIGKAINACIFINHPKVIIKFEDMKEFIGRIEEIKVLWNFTTKTN
jgi:nucleoside 2-deoxyribosyltransferase